jgi:hypothetical protein
MVPNFRTTARVKSWKIVMEFNEEGGLSSYWESAVDAASKELFGGGIKRANTSFRLSPVQANALYAGLANKLTRSACGWLCDLNGPDEPAILFRTVTIKSLHKRGLLDANFTDMRVHGNDTRGLQNLDGAVHEHSLLSPKTPKFQVWTSALGKEVLREIDLISGDNEVLH